MIQPGPGTPLRIGCLGAADIAFAALVKPASQSSSVTCYAIAARDPARAAAFAAKHGVPVTHDSYEDLLADGDVDAVYIPLPNSLHAKWTLLALQAGKHVLCEKPFTANAAEAQRVAQAAEGTGLVVMEAFHWRYHPLAERMLEIVRGGELGKVRRLEAIFAFPLPKKDNIRWSLGLAGGAMMDAGCYAVHLVRTLAGAEPSVVSADLRTRLPGVDRLARAELAFADGRTARVTASMWSARIFDMSVTVIGEQRILHVIQPTNPQHFHRLTVRGPGFERAERFRAGTTYAHQLQAFAAAVAGSDTVLTPPGDSVANMRVIDDIYRAGGLEPRRGATD
jgi:predicted dehydrogenase